MRRLVAGCDFSVTYNALVYQKQLVFRTGCRLTDSDLVQYFMRSIVQTVEQGGELCHKPPYLLKSLIQIKIMFFIQFIETRLVDHFFLICFPYFFSVRYCHLFKLDITFSSFFFLHRHIGACDYAQNKYFYKKKILVILLTRPS